MGEWRWVVETGGGDGTETGSVTKKNKNKNRRPISWIKRRATTK